MRKLRKSALAAGFRSGLEQDNAELLEEMGIPYEYEKERITYVDKIKTYTPDIKLLSSGILIETKGRFFSRDRAKHLLIKKQRPMLDIRFVFSNSKAKLSKTSKTTYGGWCERHGFLYADKLIPKEWLQALVPK